MTKSDGKYPNKEDLEPKVPGAASSDELPLADPSDSNTSDIFRKNALEIVGEHSQSAFGANKPDASYNILNRANVSHMVTKRNMTANSISYRMISGTK